MICSGGSLGGMLNSTEGKVFTLVSWFRSIGPGVLPLSSLFIRFGAGKISIDDVSQGQFDFCVVANMPDKKRVTE